MRQFTPLRALTLAALVLACAPTRALTQDELTPFFDARVVGVLDGNTISVSNTSTGQQVYVRLRGIDAPEMQQPRGADARQNLARLVAGKVVRVEFKTTDRMGTVEGRVALDGDDVNLAQLAAGMAWFRTAYYNELSDDQKKLYRDAEAEARAARRGLWQDDAPAPPWEYRAAKKIVEDPRDIPQPAAGAAKSVNADRRSRLYYAPGCAGYDRVPARSRARFKSAAEAERAGYKPAPGCQP
ncbi:MAG: thermonuclease family protein [Acidobacteria bacterium]|nr:thermonuclease family protein [Acidobacteriota bacterium]